MEKHEQTVFFKKELNSIRKNEELKDSIIPSLHPFLDDPGILRITGRLSFFSVAEEVNHPTILPSDSKSTTSVAFAARRKTLHGGVRDSLVGL